jgi:hypothetical protein
MFSEVGNLDVVIACLSTALLWGVVFCFTSPDPSGESKEQEKERKRKRLFQKDFVKRVFSMEPKGGKRKIKRKR